MTGHEGVLEDKWDLNPDMSPLSWSITHFLRASLVRGDKLVHNVPCAETTSCNPDSHHTRELSMGTTIHNMEHAASCILASATYN